MRQRVKEREKEVYERALGTGEETAEIAFQFQRLIVFGGTGTEIKLYIVETFNDISL